MRSPNPLSVRATLLQALTWGPGFGIELIARIKKLSGGLQLRDGAVYPALGDLEKAGLIRSMAYKEATPDPRRGGRPRIYYCLTAKGRRLAEKNGAMVRGLFS
jgi:PadR family transcriptional regulator